MRYGGVQHWQLRHSSLALLQGALPFSSYDSSILSRTRGHVVSANRARRIEKGWTYVYMGLKRLASLVDRAVGNKRRSIPLALGLFVKSSSLSESSTTSCLDRIPRFEDSKSECSSEATYVFQEIFALNA